MCIRITLPFDFFFRNTTMYLIPVWVSVILVSSYAFESQCFQLPVSEAFSLKSVVQDTTETTAGVADRVAGTSAIVAKGVTGTSADVAKGEADTLTSVAQRAVKPTKGEAKGVIGTLDSVAKEVAGTLAGVAKNVAGTSAKVVKRETGTSNSVAKREARALGCAAKGGQRGLVSFLTDTIKGVAGTATEAAKQVAQFTGTVVHQIMETVKDISKPATTEIFKLVSTGCKWLKIVIKNTVHVVTGVPEPDVKTLKIVLKTPFGLTTHPISEAYRTILNEKLFNKTKKTVLYIHGFMDDPTGDSFTTVSDAFFKKGDYNILALDGSSLIKWLYPRAAKYVKFMGEKLGKVLAEIVKNGVPRKNILIIGHSLGSHIAGFTGKMFKNITGQKLPRISSLDPAGPCFVNLEDDQRLSKDDAEFVDVMHTNAGVFGLKENVGHVDFYPNGGFRQPGCAVSTCEHSRAWEYYAESVTDPNSFIARMCEDWEQFMNNQCEGSVKSSVGYSVNPRLRGVFYLRTNDTSPFGLRKKGLDVSRWKTYQAIAKELALQDASQILDLMC